MTLACPSPQAHSAVLDTFEVRRDTVDLVATLRAKNIRVALFGNYLLPNAPAHSDMTPEKREHHLNVLRAMVLSMESVGDLCAGHSQLDTVPQSVKDWIYDIARVHPQLVKDMTTMIVASRKVLDTCEANSPELPKVLAHHYKLGRGGFTETVTEFCNALWASIDAKRSKEAEKAAQATKAVGDTLNRLEHIGKHVRLVSLNASVEAARAGDAGRGLAVIASEFKTLAEEIQKLATGARSEIESIK